MKYFQGTSAIIVWILVEIKGVDDIANLIDGDVVMNRNFSKVYVDGWWCITPIAV